MKWIEVKNYQEMSQMAADIIIQKVNEAASLTLGLATGGTPLGTYQYLIDDVRKHHTSYQHVQTVNLDEYVGLDQADPNSYQTYMRINAFQPLGIPFVNTHLPNGQAPDLTAECERYEALIKELGGVDLQLLGIGENGHIGFNEPGTSFGSRTHVVELTESTRLANARYFTELKDVPTHAITMGIATIMQSKQILLLASGANKAQIVAKLMDGKIDKTVPASVLQMHPNVTIIADVEARSQVKEREICFLK
jgi:glucosamine-6-phosphate deaminase